MSNKSAIITGASKGIGKKVAKHLAHQGFNILSISRSKNLLAELQKELQENNINLIVKTAAIDVSHADEVNLAIADFYSLRVGIIPKYFSHNEPTIAIKKIFWLTQ